MRKFIAQHEKRSNIDHLQTLQEHELADHLAQHCPMWIIVRSG